jgi:hypothetical protein
MYGIVVIGLSIKLYNPADIPDGEGPAMRRMYGLVVIRLSIAVTKQLYGVFPIFFLVVIIMVVDGAHNDGGSYTRA